MGYQWCPIIAAKCKREVVGHMVIKVSCFSSRLRTRLRLFCLGSVELPESREEDPNVNCSPGHV